MVTPEARIRLHRIRSDQMYHHYLGDPLEVLLLHPEGEPPDVELGDRDHLIATHPGFRDEIIDFTK